MLGFFILVFVLAIGPIAFAEIEQSEQISKCEEKYLEFLDIGETKFNQRYQYSFDYKYCLTLYKNSLWESENLNRISVLLEVLSELRGEKISKMVRDRPGQEDLITPQWVKTDAKLWYEGKQTDSRFAYGLRYLVESNIIIPPTNTQTLNESCDSGKLCVKENNYIKYTHKDNTGKIDIITDRFGKIKNNQINVESEKISSLGKEKINFLLDLKTGITNIQNDDKTCCKSYRIAYPVSDNYETSKNLIEKIKVTYNDKILHSNVNRDVVIAINSSNDYTEIIDKNTGIVFVSEFTERPEQNYFWEKIQITDTNMFVEKSRIQYNQLKIPHWLKSPTQWWSEGLISDTEYYLSLEYLISKSIIQI